MSELCDLCHPGWTFVDNILPDIYFELAYHKSMDRYAYILQGEIVLLAGGDPYPDPIVPRFEQIWPDDHPIWDASNRWLNRASSFAEFITKDLPRYGIQTSWQLYDAGLKVGYKHGYGVSEDDDCGYFEYWLYDRIGRMIGRHVK